MQPTLEGGGGGGRGRKGEEGQEGGGRKGVIFDSNPAILITKEKHRKKPADKEAKKRKCRDLATVTTSLREEAK